MIEERLLGFDVREWDSQADGLWDGARRELFLLRLDVLRPLSADRLVWPSVLGSTPSDDWARPGRQGIPLPQYTGPNTGLWEDAAAMLRYLRANWTQPRPSAVLACTWLSDKGFLEAGTYGPHLEPAFRRRAGRGGLLGVSCMARSALSAHFLLRGLRPPSRLWSKPPAARHEHFAV